MSEQTFKESVLEKLSRNFHVFEEVKGQHFSGKRLRIDAVVTEKPYQQRERRSDDDIQQTRSTSHRHT